MKLGLPPLRFSIRTKILAILIILTITPLVILTVLNLQQTTSHLDRLAVSISENTLVVVNKAMQENTALADALVTNESFIQSLTTKDTAEAVKVAALEFPEYHYVDLLRVVDRTGKIVASPSRPEEVGRNVADDLFVKTGLAGGGFRNTFISTEDGDVYSTVLPVLYQGEVVGVVVSTSNIMSLFRKVTALEAGKIAVVYGRNDEVAFTPFPNMTKLPPNVAAHLEVYKAIKEGEEEKAKQLLKPVAITEHDDLFVDDKGVPWNYLIKPFFIGDGDEYLGSVFVFASDKPMQELEKAAIQNFMVILAAIVVVVAAIGIGASNYITSPIRTLTDTMRYIEEGDFTHRANIKTGDEIEEMAKDLNLMLDKVLVYASTEEEYRGFQHRLTELLSAAASVAEGDLRVKARVTEDQLGVLADSFNLMTSELRDLLAKIQKATAEVTQNANRILEPTENLEKVIEEEVHEINVITETVKVMASDIQQISLLSTEVASQSQNTVKIAHEGGEAVAEALKESESIAEHVSFAAEKIASLSRGAEEIGKIVTLIGDISEQTNMLALNAAIEAARAGDQGKGFSVVSEEIRQLADRTSKSAQEITTLIRNIIREMGETVTAISEANKGVKEGAKISQRTRKALNDIIEANAKLAQSINQINETATKENEKAIQIADRIKELTANTVQVSSTVKETTNRIKELPNVTSALEQAVRRFKINP